MASEGSFGQILANLVIDAGYITGTFGPDWTGFVATIPGVQYESLRKALSGEREPSVKIMEAVAKTLNVDPNVFTEYRRYRLLEEVAAMDENELAALSRWLRRRQ